MPWSFSFQLLPGETVVEDTTRNKHELVKPAYSVFLTDRRVIFRFDGLGSNLCKSFRYDEIIEAVPSTRLFIGYLRVRTRSKETLFHVHDAEHLASRIAELKAQYTPEAPAGPSGVQESAAMRKKALLDMLVTLRKHGLLDDEEFERKVSRLDTLNLS